MVSAVFVDDSSAAAAAGPEKGRSRPGGRLERARGSHVRYEMMIVAVSDLLLLIRRPIQAVARRDVNVGTSAETHTDAERPVRLWADLCTNSG